jgi:biotin carboxylase
MCKKVVVIAGGKYQLSGIKELKKQGYYVIVFDKIKYDITKEVADELVLIDIKDYNKMINYLVSHNHKITHVMSFATELALNSVIKLKEYFNINYGISKKDVLFSNNKYLQNTIKKESNIPYAKFFKINSKKIFFNLLKKKYIKFPCIVKPIDGAGSRGVCVVNNKQEFNKAYKEAFKNTNSKYILVEELINGIEFTFDAFIQDKNIDILAIAEKTKPLNNLTVSTQLFYNSPLVLKIKEQAVRIITKYLKNSNLNNTIVHLEFIYNLKSKKIYIIETSVRSGGFGVFDEILPLVTNCDIVKYFIDLNIGKKVNKIKNKNRAVILKFFTANNGTFDDIYYIDKKLKIKNLYYKIFKNNIGKYYNITDDSSRSILGYMVCYGKSWKKVLHKTNTMQNNIRFIMR